MAAAGFHLFACSDRCSGPLNPSLTTSCTLVREWTSLPQVLSWEYCQAAGTAWPVSLLVGLIYPREPPWHLDHFPWRSHVSTSAHLFVSSRDFLCGACLSLTEEQRNTFARASHSLMRIYPLTVLDYAVRAHQGLFLPPWSSLIITTMQWIGSGSKSSWKMTRELSLQHTKFKQGPLPTLLNSCAEGTAWSKKSWVAKGIQWLSTASAKVAFQIFHV